MKPLVVAALGMTVLSAACVRQERFRFVPDQSSCFAPEAAGARPEEHTANQKPSLDCRHSLYSLAFIEFDSQGKAFDANQEAAALKLIERRKAATKDGKVITVVYLHGWKNNAAEALPGGKAKDVERFQSALLELGYRASKVAADGKEPVPIVGIYVGWRGKSLMGPNWFTFLSYWGRRNTANRVGHGPDLAVILNRIIDRTNEGRGKSRVLLIGHSFGARVLEHAVETQKIKLYDTVPESGFVSPRVDLVLYVNSANDARLSMARVQALIAHPVKVRHPDYNPPDCDDLSVLLAPADDETSAARCRDYPLLVAITSKGDLATKYLLPIATTVNGDGKSAPMPIPPSQDGFADPLPSAGVYKRIAAGHFPFLHSHVVREITCPGAAALTARPGSAKTIEETIDEAVTKAVEKALGKTATTEQREKEARALRQQREQEEAEQRERALRPVCAAGDASCRFAFRTLGDQPTCFQVDERGRVDGRPPFNRTAFWIMDVEPTVMKDHGDIWNLSFVEMLGQLMAPRGFFDPAMGRIQLRATPITPIPVK